MKVEPTCKYGHGPLEPQEAEGPTTWVIPAIDLESLRNVYSSESADVLAALKQPMFPGVFSFLIYRCKTCGYVEFFDFEVPDGGA